ncbi:hypothetical protein [Nonomuraea sp. LPB2021202275-12-8]|uniref:hypothetical protein n=1 Tax=Nonomuraea sp. LPB2021202275-12-8 TaxID=3120159 RepID=UPI00300C7535
MRRRSSGDIDLGIVGPIALLVTVAAIAVAVASADDEEAVQEVSAVCVAASPAEDGSYQVMDDRLCDGGSHAAYHYWLYGSSTSRSGYVRGGTTTRPASAQIVTRSGKVIQRGGFGGRGTSGG